jgi:ABC-type transporter MlaC component
MQPSELDATYTQLAQAIHSAGPCSELFLAMLSLKLISQSNVPKAMQQTIADVLSDLQHHDRKTREGSSS